MIESDLIQLGRAARLIGISQNTLRKRIRSGELQTYRLPLDKRVRLVREADIAALTTPQPVADVAKPIPPVAPV